MIFTLFNAFITAVTENARDVVKSVMMLPLVVPRMPRVRREMTRGLVDEKKTRRKRKTRIGEISVTKKSATERKKRIGIAKDHVAVVRVIVGIKTSKYNF